MMPDHDLRNRPVVLLVEDDISDVQLINVALKRTPGEINLIRVEDGDTAVDYLNGTAPFNDRKMYPLPVTMLLDIKLPKRSGLEVLQWLRSQEGPIRRLPTIVLTSSTHRKDVNRAFDGGANAYFAKPESIKDLAAILAEFKTFWLQRVEFPDMQGSQPPVPPSD
jgi:CheY-like chemotaxis protein